MTKLFNSISTELNVVPHPLWALAWGWPKDPKTWKS